MASKGKSSSKSSSKSRAAARGAARATARGLTSSSVAKAGNAAVASVLRAGNTQRTVSATPEDLRRYAKEEAQAQADLTAAGYSPEFVNQVTTFWQEIAKLPQGQQDSIMSQLQKQANSTVDSAFNTEEGYLNTLKAAKQKSYDEQFALFQADEQRDLEKAAGEINRGTADQLSGAFAGLANNNAFDTGAMLSLADRAVGERERILKEDRAASEASIAAARQQRDSASNLLSIQAEQDLLDVANRRQAARSMRLSQLIGLNASQNLLAQTPSVSQMSVPPPAKPARTPRPAAAPLSLPTLDASTRATDYNANTVLRRGSKSYGYADDRARTSYRNRSSLIGNY